MSMPRPTPRWSRFAVQYLVVAAAFQLFDGMQAVAAGLLRGLQDTRMPMVIALFGYWVPGFGTAILLGFFTPFRDSASGSAWRSGWWVSALLLRRWQRREACASSRLDAGRDSAAKISLLNAA